MTTIITQVEKWKIINKKNKSIGFVPTMGALHAGHLSLIKKSNAENDITLVSIFVNPTQFDEPKDFESYPQTWEEDLKKLKKLKVDYLLHPSYEELYPHQYRFKVTENKFSNQLCGKHRPGHFDGMLTIVLKLLMIANADRAYFGEKDCQQFVLIRDMAASFFLRTQIISCPTVREKNGLAMSSRNQHLSDQEKALASNFPKLLVSSQPALKVSEKLNNLGLKVDYIEDINNRRFGAVRIGKTRLIDNVPIMGQLRQ